MLELTFIILSLFCDGGPKSKNIIEDSVDIIEINHFMNSSGESQLDQVIFWDYSPSLGKYVVVAWRSIKPGFPYPYQTKSGYELLWKDTRDNTIRRVVSKSRTETWTDYDPETANQELLERNLRRELTEKPSKKKFTQSPPFIFP